MGEGSKRWMLRNPGFYVKNIQVLRFITEKLTLSVLYRVLFKVLQLAKKLYCKLQFSNETEHKSLTVFSNSNLTHELHICNRIFIIVTPKLHSPILIAPGSLRTITSVSVCHGILLLPLSILVWNNSKVTLLFPVKISFKSIIYQWFTLRGTPSLCFVLPKRRAEKNGALDFNKICSL